MVARKGTAPAAWSPRLTTQRVLLYGGSFDPVHHGHLLIARHVAERLDLPRIVLVPSASPPHKQGVRLAPADDRLAMCRLAVADDPLFAVSDWELGQPGPNYTLHTVQHFRAQLGPAAELYWLVGLDSLNELHNWHRATELVDACTLVTAARPGVPRPTAAQLAAHFTPTQVQRLLAQVIDTLLIDIASTDIRARARRGLSIRYLLPEAVRRYIAERRLYSGS